VVRVQVREPGVTNGTGAGAGITAELGHGPVGANPADWTSWTGATHSADTGSGNDDEFQATLANPGAAGSYRFAYRVRLEGGPYVYCDADGTDDGFDLADVGTLTVQDPATLFCRLQSVGGTTVGSGDVVAVTGRVRIPGVTNGAGAGAGIRVEVGLGNANVDASTNAAGFTWKQAPYVREASDEVSTDEFSTDIFPAYPGNRAVSMRYTTDGGANWVYCDKNGSDVGGYEAGQQHALTVGNPAGNDIINYCKLQWPFKTSLHNGNRDTYGRLYEPDVTNQPQAHPNMVAELGYGPREQDPGVSTSWTWIAGTFLGNPGDARDNHEYRADLPRTAPVGSWYVWRFRIGTGPYCYGDWQPNDQAGGSSNGANPDWLGEVNTEPLPLP
jgi:hypothetical protein